MSHLNSSFDAAYVGLTSFLKFNFCFHRELVVAVQEISFCCRLKTLLKLVWNLANLVMLDNFKGSVIFGFHNIFEWFFYSCITSRSWTNVMNHCFPEILGDISSIFLIIAWYKVQNIHEYKHFVKTLRFKNRKANSAKKSPHCVVVVVRDLVRTKAYFVWRPSFAFSTYLPSWQALRSLALRGLHFLTLTPNGVKFSLKSQLKSLKTLFDRFFFQYLSDLW